MNTMRLLENMKELRFDRQLKIHKITPLAVFIDFSSAYDMVLRDKLYKLIRSKKILDENEIQLTNYFHDKLTIVMGKDTCTPETGVPQGALTSPSFFDIYSETLLN